jgi:hypothetical protein
MIGHVAAMPICEFQRLHRYHSLRESRELDLAGQAVSNPDQHVFGTRNNPIIVSEISIVDKFTELDQGFIDQAYDRCISITRFKLRMKCDSSSEESRF